ncbi:MAG: hypothetical protein JXJ17_14230 [Anaerolineae bacterium]|nr:hypothetical protein [Anaerolineae bacterium]
MDASNGVEAGMNLSKWLWLVVISLGGAYGIYRGLRFLLIRLQPRTSDPAHCAICGVEEYDLLKCDDCGLSICRRHTTIYRTGIQEELIKPTDSSDQHYRRVRSLPPGIRCLRCDRSRLIALVIAIVAGNVFFIMIFRWMLSP